MGDPAEEERILGIARLEDRKTVAYCLRRGWWSVNFPVVALIGAAFGLPLLILPPQTPIAHSLGSHDPGPLWGMMAFPALLLLVIALISPAWLWWSVATPKWRIWALQNVDDWRNLEQAAILAKLIWPRGSVFNLTEIKSSAQKELEYKLIEYRDQNG
ncbi:MAG: hypothetical protein H0U98_02090 [Alphaproteobacteria bacterium]|nr:hypothetical protein [Alphaproteobacteria bacterium]